LLFYLFFKLIYFFETAGRTVEGALSVDVVSPAKVSLVNRQTENPFIGGPPPIFVTYFKELSVEDGIFIN